MRRSVLLTLISFFSFTCTNNKAEKPVDVATLSPVYYFYPRANVYFDSANKEYLFIANDGATWQTQKQIPAAMQAMMDKNVFIDSPAQPVWKDNERHKLIYSALLYASPADTQTIKAPPPPVPEPPKEVKKERKGIGKFLNKIFGKKKKDTTAKG